MEFKVRPLTGSKVAILVQCRNWAEAFRIVAQDTAEPLARNMMLQAAESYDLLAANAEKSLKDA